MILEFLYSITNFKFVSSNCQAVIYAINFCVCAFIKVKTPIERGSSKWLTCDSNIGYAKWLDTRVVHVISTAFSPSETQLANRTQRWNIRAKRVSQSTVTTKERATHLLTLYRHVNKKSTILTDCWKAYYQLECEGWTHKTVNHEYNFVGECMCML